MRLLKADIAVSGFASRVVPPVKLHAGIGPVLGKRRQSRKSLCLCLCKKKKKEKKGYPETGGFWEPVPGKQSRRGNIWNGYSASFFGLCRGREQVQQTPGGGKLRGDGAPGGLFVGYGLVRAYNEGGVPSAGGGGFAGVAVIAAGEVS
jgi:hypothetical protein